MISTYNLTCGYGKREVLSNVNITFEPNNITCLLGRNGTGKTTLFKTVLRLLPVLKGNICYNNIDIQKLSSKEVAGLISYVPQAHGTPFPFSVLDVVVMGQFIHTKGAFGKPKSHNIDIAHDCIKALGIEKLTKKSFKKISGGEKQMVLIARAMAQKPKYIAMDEPTANLDMGNSIRVMKVARMLTEKGYGVIMNTHDPAQALDFAHKVIILKNSTVSHIGDPNDILKTDIISDLYNTRIELVEAETQKGEKRKVLLTL